MSSPDIALLQLKVDFVFNAATDLPAAVMQWCKRHLPTVKLAECSSSLLDQVGF